MMVRCGRCQTAFEVEGEGRFSCPACGTANDVRGGVGAPSDGGLITPPPPPEDAGPSPRAKCSRCEFSFIVGDVAEVQCPNCGVTVTVSDVEGDA